MFSHKPVTPHQAKPRAIKTIDHHVGLDPDEEVLLLARRHWVIFRNSLFVGLFIPFVLLSIYGLSTQLVLGGFEAYRSAIFWSIAAISIVCFILGMVRFLWHYHMWQHTFYVMTTKKLAIINRHKPWSYQVQQIALNNINDVTLRQEGMEAFMYGYSDVVAITYSGSHFTFKQVAHAPLVQKTIMQQLAVQERPATLGKGVEEQTNH